MESDQDGENTWQAQSCRQCRVILCSQKKISKQQRPKYCWKYTNLAGYTKYFLFLFKNWSRFFPFGSSQSRTRNRCSVGCIGCFFPHLKERKSYTFMRSSSKTEMLTLYPPGSRLFWTVSSVNHNGLSWAWLFNLAWVRHPHIFQFFCAAADQVTAGSSKQHSAELSIEHYYIWDAGVTGPSQGFGDRHMLTFYRRKSWIIQL